MKEFIDSNVIENDFKNSFRRVKKNREREETGNSSLFCFKFASQLNSIEKSDNP
jgi:hypothetical protein